MPFFQSPTVTRQDHLGHEVSILTESWRALPKDERKKLNRWIIKSKWSSCSRTVRVIVIFEFVFATVSAFIVPPMVQWFVIVPVLLVGTITGVQRSSKDDSIRLVSDGLLDLGRCGSCSHPIASLPCEADGCTICPECGAAWRLVAVKNIETS